MRKARSRTRSNLSPLCCVMLALVMLGSTPVASATKPAFTVLGSVFFIAKSENKNQVHYAVKVDDHCRPVGNSPLYGYWREQERGPRVTSPLLKHEQSAYGLTEPRWIKPRDQGGEIRIGLRGFPDRPLTIETYMSEAQCRARARTTIAGQDAVLSSIFVQIGFLFSIDYVILRGTRLADGKPVQEKVND
jgi:hypothetical protein